MPRFSRALQRALIPAAATAVAALAAGTAPASAHVHVDADDSPAAQTYSDRTVVRWDQPPLPDGGEPEHPAPTLTLTTAAPPAQHGDTTALWLAVAALAVGTAGVVLTLVRRRP